MSQLLPLFPLQIVVFPGEKLPLHIFEERYRQLIADCEASGQTFGIPTYLRGKLEFGCEMILQKVAKRYAGGESDVVCKGSRVFRLRQFVNPMDQRLYPGGEVEFLNDERDADHELRETTVNLLYELYDLIGVGYEPIDPFFFESFAYGHRMGLNLDQEYELLTLNKESERLMFLIEHLSRVIPIIRQVNSTKQLIQMNGHFRNYDPLDFRDFKL